MRYRNLKNIVLRSRRSQMTVFIILGLVIMMIFLLVLYITGLKQQDTLPPSEEEIKYIAEQCIKRSAEHGLHLIGLQGGYISISKPHFETEISNVTYSRYLPSLSNMGVDLAEYINNHVVTCIYNFTKTRSIKMSTPDAQVKFGQRNVIITIDDFISINKNDSITKIETIMSDAIRVRIPLMHSMISQLDEGKINMDALSEYGFNTTVLKYSDGKTLYVITDLDSNIRAMRFRFLTATLT